MKKYLLATLIAAALVLAVVLVRVYSVPRLGPAALGVRLAFVGLTNVPSRGRFAVFIVTNAGPERVAFDPDALEYRVPQGWATNSLRNQTRRDWLCWHQDPAGGLKLGKWDDFGSDLRSGMSVRFGAPVTITDAVWRLDFYCVEQATGVQGFRDRVGDLVQRTVSVITNGVARDETTFTGRRYHLLSPEISE